MNKFSVQIEQISIEHDFSRLGNSELPPSATMFTSPAWTQAWLKSLPSTDSVQTITVCRGNQPIGLTYCAFNTTRRFFISKKTSCFLNQYGDICIDDLFIEFNEIVSRKSDKQAVYNEILCHILKSGIADEIVFSGVTSDTLELIKEITKQNRIKLTIARNMPYYYINTDPAKTDHNFYENSLSPNTKRQIKRSISLYQEKYGHLQIIRAKDTEQALTFFSHLRAIHTQHWQTKGRLGAFYSEELKTFHYNLIQDSFLSGLIQLLEIKAGSHLIGYLYNFKYNNKIYCYQSGFIYNDDNKLKPGLTSHWLAIQAAIHDKISEYHFLAGDARYKRSLSTHSDEMYWIKLKNT